MFVAVTKYILLNCTGIKIQVAATTNKEVDGHIPNYPSLPAQLICQLHNVTMHVGYILNRAYMLGVSCRSPKE